MMFAQVKELEECILFLVAILENKAYPAKITAELFGRTSRRISVASVHSILNDFEREGVLISSTKAEANSPRKRVYALTDYGRRVNNIPYLKETLHELLSLHGNAIHKLNQI